MENLNGLEIKNGVLVRCSSEAAHITIPEGVTAIGDGAFRGCKTLVSVTIPASVLLVGKWAFFGCDSLENVSLPEGAAIGHDAFKNCKKLFDNNGFLCVGAWLLGFNGKAESVIVPEGVKTIRRNAFFGCDSLREVTIPEGITEIKDGAFSSCYALKSVRIPDSVQLFGDEVFIDCLSLESIICPDSVAEKLNKSEAGHIIKMNSDSK